MVSTFKIATPKAKYSFRTASVLFPTLITFYKIYSVFGIAIKRFVDAVNFVYMYVLYIQVSIVISNISNMLESTSYHSLQKIMMLQFNSHSGMSKWVYCGQNYLETWLWFWGES